MSNPAWVVLALLVLVGLWVMMTYNGLVTLRKRCRQAFSDICGSHFSVAHPSWMTTALAPLPESPSATRRSPRRSTRSGTSAAHRSYARPANTARGPIVEDAALHQPFVEGWIAGAAVDDIEEEPAKQRDWRPANPLFQLESVIITPHAAYYSEESIGAVRRIAAEEAVRVLSGLPALSPVNTIPA
jgi:hypothetical protein